MTSWKRFADNKTITLINLCQNADEDKADRDDAFLALCFRFRLDLLNKCEIICRNRGYDIDVAQTIVRNTLKKYGKSRKFILEKGSQTNADDCFKVYLYTIARNELTNYYHNEVKRKNGQLYDGTEKIITKLPEIDIDRLSPEDRIVHETLLSLPYSHQVIYLTYTTHEKDGVNLPKKLRAELRDHLGGISQTTVRSYKKVAIDKIEGAKRIIEKLNASYE